MEGRTTSATMRSAAVFGTYLVIVGAFLLIAPTTFTDLFKMPEGEPAYLRVIGTLVTSLGFYYLSASRDGNVDFLRRTILGRAFAATALVVIGVSSGEIVIAAFSVPDYLSAVWTWRTMAAETPRASS